MSDENTTPDQDEATEQTSDQAPERVSAGDIAQIISSHEARLNERKGEMELARESVREVSTEQSGALDQARDEMAERIKQVKDEEEEKIRQVRESFAEQRDAAQRDLDSATDAYKDAINTATSEKFLTKQILAAMGHTLPRGGRRAAK